MVNEIDNLLKTTESINDKYKIDEVQDIEIENIDNIELDD
jgi:hypothetical protein